MLYNKNHKRVKHASDCLTCRYYDKKYRKCLGLGKVCFEYDDKLQIVVDPITRLPINLNKIK